MENLNKENFWNEMMDKYPLATKDFCEWVDKYKKKNSWDFLFSWNFHPATNNPERIGEENRRAKFHDLPLAMQMGIWNEFMSSYSLMQCKSDVETFLDATEKGIEESNKQDK